MTSEDPHPTPNEHQIPVLHDVVLPGEAIPPPQPQAGNTPGAGEAQAALAPELLERRAEQMAERLSQELVPRLAEQARTTLEQALEHALGEALDQAIQRLVDDLQAMIRKQAPDMLRAVWTESERGDSDA